MVRNTKDKELTPRQKKLQEKLDKLFAGSKTIQEVVDENTNKEKIEQIGNGIEKKSNEQNPLKTVGVGFISNLLSGVPAVVGLGTAIGEGIGGTIAKATLPKEDKKYLSNMEILQQSLDNKALNLANDIDRGTRKFFNAKQFEDLTGTEQLLDITGSLINPRGIIKKPLDKLSRMAAKSAADSAKSKKVAEIISKNSNITKNVAEKSQEVIDVAKSAAKSARNKTDFVTNLVLPGLQITKDASLVQKGVEGALQAGIPLAVNEMVRKSAKQEGIFGDYREKPEEKLNITLLPGKNYFGKKKYVEQLNEDLVQNYTIDKKVEEDDTLSDALTYTGLALGAIAAPKMIAKGLNVLPSRVKDNKLVKNLAKQLQVTNKTNKFDDTLSKSTQLDIATADRYAWKNAAVDADLISEQTKANFARDLSNEIDGTFATGIVKNIGDADIDFGVSPQQVWNKLDTLQATDAKSYEDFERFLELGSQIQDEANRFNIFSREIEPRSMSTDEYIKSRELIDTTNDPAYTTKKTFNNKYNEYKKLKQSLQNNPVTKGIIDDVAKISDGLLQVLEKSDMYDEKIIQYLRKNRTIDDLMLYKPRVNEKSFSLLDSLHDLFFSREPFDPDVIDNVRVRGEDYIKNAKPYKEVLEENIKNTLKQVKNNDIKYKTIKEMENKTITKVNEELDSFSKYVDELQFGDDFPDMSKFYSDVDDIFYVRELGSRSLVDLNENPVHGKSFFDIINRKQDKLYSKDSYIGKVFENKYGQNADEYRRATEKLKQSDDVVSVIHNGREYFYKVPKVTKAAFDFNPKLPSLIAEWLRWTKNFAQRTVTGNLFNPLFAIRSSIYSTDESLTMLPKIADDLGIKNVKAKEYLKEYSKASKEIKANILSTRLADRMSQVLVETGTNMDSPAAKGLMKFTAEDIRTKINKNLLTQIQLSGGASSKPINTTKSGTFYNITNNTILSPKLRYQISKIYGKSGAENVINMINLMQTVARETPSYALTRYLGKKSGAIVNDSIKDVEKLKKVIDSVGTYTANVGRSGTGKGISGNFASFMKNYLPFGNISLQSIAAKSRGINWQKSGEVLRQWVDPNVRFIDLIDTIHKYGKQIPENKFIQGLFVTTFLPSIIAYAWNHGNEENRNAYYSMSDYDKGKGYVLVNALGNGRHIVIPRDQEVQIFGALTNVALDAVFGGSKQQEINPAFKNSTTLMNSLARSLQLDPPPAAKVGLAQLGYRINPTSVFTQDNYIDELKNVTNTDLTETKFENGILSAESYESISAAAGMFGTMISTILEEITKTDSKKQNIVNASQALGEKLLNSARIWTNKVNSFNDTSREVYNKINFIEKLEQIKNKNSKQQEIYNLIINYRRNRINPIHNKVKELRSEIKQLNNTSEYKGKLINYNSRVEIINEINKKLQKLFALEREEFNNLDLLIEQLYGKDTNLQNFMQKFN